MIIMKRMLLRIGYYIIRAFTRVNDKKIVFSSYYGKGYGDNGKYICNELLRRGKGYDVVWIAKNDKETFPTGVRAVKYNSLKSFIEMASAKVWIDNSRKPSYISKKKKQFYIQTWHGGLGLKKIEAEASDLDATYIKSAKNDSRMADLMISNGKYRTEQYKKNFWYCGEIIETGLPRNDSFFNRVDKESICKELGVNNDKKIILYAPTFRVYDYDYLQIPFIELAKSMEVKTGKQYIILVRLHPNVAKKVKIPENKYVINASFYPDADELIAISDYVISDYSSIMFDAVYSDTPVYLYAPDYDKYSSGRGFTLNYKELPYNIAYTAQELIEMMSSSRHMAMKKKLDAFISKQGLCDDGHASERVCDIIENVIRGKDENEKI